jgi:hypothetical protein
LTGYVTSFVSGHSSFTFDLSRCFSLCFSLCDCPPCFPRACNSPAFDRRLLPLSGYSYF